MSGSPSQHPRSVQEYYNAGKSLCEQGHFETALTELQAAAALTPHSAAVHFWIGKAQLGLGNTARAVTSFQQSARLDPGNALPYLELGKVNAAADQLGAALASFRQAQRRSPRNTEAHRQIAMVLIQQAQFDPALDELQQALQIEPNVGATYVLLGRVYDLKGMKPQADAAFGQGERLDPRFYALAQIANGMQMQEAGRINDALQQYHHATLTDPTFALAFLKLGGAYSAKSQFEDAAAAFRAAARLNSGDSNAHYLLGYTLLYLSRNILRNAWKSVLGQSTAPPAEAVQALRTAVTLNPKDAPAQLALGQAYLYSGAKVLAREHLEQVLTLEPTGAYASTARNLLTTL